MDKSNWRKHSKGWVKNDRKLSTKKTQDWSFLSFFLFSFYSFSFVSFFFPPFEWRNARLLNLTGIQIVTSTTWRTREALSAGDNRPSSYEWWVTRAALGYLVANRGYGGGGLNSDQSGRQRRRRSERARAVRSSDSSLAVMRKVWRIRAWWDGCSWRAVMSFATLQEWKIVSFDDSELFEGVASFETAQSPKSWGLRSFCCIIWSCKWQEGILLWNLLFGSVIRIHLCFSSFG